MREDAREVGALAKQLRERHIEIWLDEPNQPELGLDLSDFTGGSTDVGRDWRRSEHNGLETASCIVGFWSKHAITERPREFRSEAAIGLERGCYIPVLLDNSDPSKFGQPFDRLHFTKIWQRDDALVSVLAAIRSHMHRTRLERRKQNTLTREQASYWLDRRKQIDRIWHVLEEWTGAEAPTPAPVFSFNHTDQDSVDLFMRRLIDRERLHLAAASKRDKTSNPGAEPIHLHLDVLADATDAASFQEALARWLLARLEDHDRMRSSKRSAFERLRELLIARHSVPGPAEIIVARADFADPLFAQSRVRWLASAWALLTQGLAPGSILLFVAARHSNWLSRLSTGASRADTIQPGADVRMIDLGWFPAIDATEAQHWQSDLNSEWGVVERDRLARDIKSALSLALGSRLPMARFLERIQFPLTCQRRT